MIAPLKHLNPLSQARLSACRSRLEDLFRKAVEERTFSGASLLVAAPDKAVIEMLFGKRKTDGQPVRSDTWFDLASLTKPLVTASLCLKAVNDGIFALDSPIREFIPALTVPPDKRAITIRQLLGHCSGLPAYNPWYRDLIRVPSGRRSTVLLSWILDTPLLSTPGCVSCYSDLGFLLLGMLLENALGAPLDELASRFLFRPHGLLDELGFLRLKSGCDPTIPPERPDTGPLEFAATEECPWRKRLLEGEVHDEHAYCLDGVAGHAGLFGTARGVLRLLAPLRQVYRGDPGATVRRQILESFWTRQEPVEAGTWALGFDTPSGTGSSSGAHFSPRSVGHLGFTGTSFWLDLERDVLIILLTNRVHPTRNHERMKVFRPLVHNLVMETLNEFT